MIIGLQNANPDFIFTLFSYKEGNKIVDVISKSPLNGKVPLLAAPSMTGEMNSSENINIDNLFSISSWAFDEETPLMKSFRTNYSALFNDAPNVISLLGYEVGLTIFAFLEKNQDIPARIGDYVKTLTFESPRGELKFSGFNESQVLNNQVRQFLLNAGRYKNTIINTIDLSDQEELYDKFKDLPYSGWQNPYLIT
jgi:ABC-type branched-subunit amino acid transport system substrate-binding protein